MRRNCLLKHVIKGQIKGSVGVTGRQRIRRKQLLYELRGKRSYWKTKEVALNCAVRRTGFGRGCGPVVRQNTE